MGLIIPAHYDPRLSVRETQEAIKYIRDTFQKEFGKEMNLSRISAPLFVEKSSGLNDNLNGVERPVSFDVPWNPEETIEVVQSLAKWKRLALKRYHFEAGEGLYTNMNAIRRDEEPDNLHSVYVDQWDWERVISKEERNEETLRETVRNIFRIIKHMEHDWNLNGDILFWFENLNCALEISSMGIRVNEESLRRQLALSHKEEREALPYHKMLLEGKLPLTIGGGIGQSRLCMLLLDRAHIGEVQASIWPEEMREECEKHNIILL